jgi:microcystin-dependent protein
MATILNRTTTFATNGTVTAAGLHNLIDDTSIYAGLITTQTELTTVGTADQLLIAVGGVSDTGAPRRATVQNLFDDALTSGTYSEIHTSGSLTYGTATGNRTVSTSATITTGTIATLNSTTGTIATLNSTAGTIATLNSTAGTIATLNSTAGTIGNLSTTLAGDFTISQGTGTLGTSGVTLGTYGSVTAIPFLTVNAKGIITAATTGTFSTFPVGTVMSFAMTSAPSGWLETNGAAVSRATYADLFTSTSTTFGTGNGSTTFNLPDLRGEFVRGWDNARGIDSGRVFGATQTDAMQGHVHTFSALVSNLGGGTGIAPATSNVGRYNGTTASPSDDGVNGTPRTASETRPRNVALFYCIKF